MASITYQNYFKLYKKISGCTGTAATEAEEFFEIYNLQVVVIPTNKEMIRNDFNDLIFRTENEKNNAIISKIIDRHQLGQPILVFTSSINKSEIYSNLLNKKNIKHVVLNAKNHENEAEIISNAGKEKSLIITTSISGRGVDIQLGGKKGSIPEDQLKIDKDKIKSLGFNQVGISILFFSYYNIKMFLVIFFQNSSYRFNANLNLFKCFL